MKRCSLILHSPTENRDILLLSLKLIRCTLKNKVQVDVQPQQDMRINAESTWSEGGVPWRSSAAKSVILVPKTGSISSGVSQHDMNNTIYLIVDLSLCLRFS